MSRLILDSLEFLERASLDRVAGYGSSSLRVTLDKELVESLVIHVDVRM